jgi:restriction system protein
LKPAHDRTAADAHSKAAAANAVIQGQQAAFAIGQPEAVEWFVNHVLTASPYPADFPHQHQVAYRPENRDVVEFELPPQQVVPQSEGADS